MQVPDAADLVEDSVRVLDEAPLTDAEFWGDVERLYDFHDEYETRPTYFRVMELLERRGYFLTVPLKDHPGYEEHREAFEAFDPASVSPVLRRPGADWSEEDNPVVGYAADGELYVARGGELWEELVGAGRLEGDEAEPPQERSLPRAVRDVVEAADRGDEPDSMLRWYVTLGFHLGFRAAEGEEEELVEELRADADLTWIRERVGAVENLEFELAHPERGLEVPPPALREAHAVLSWWYEPV